MVMKIALICRGRTNSTAIGKSLAANKNLEWVGENYFWFHEELVRWLHYRPKYDKTLAFKKFTEIIKDETYKISLQDNFVIKIFPSILHFPPSLMFENTSFESVKNDFIFDTNLIKLNTYDQYYFLDRNFRYSTLSWIYAFQTSQFHQPKINKRNYYKITLNKTDFARTKFYIIEYLMQQKMRKYLENNKIPFTLIDESCYSDYIDNTKLGTEKTSINYEHYIENIKELDSFIDYWYPICEQETSNWNFY